MNWSALTKKQQQMVFMTGLLAVGQVVLMAHFLGWTKPASVRGGSAKKELIAVKQKIEDARAIIRQEEAIRRSMDQSVGELEALLVYTPALSDRYAWAYEYVSRCATQSKVSLDNLEEVIVKSDDQKEVSDQPYEINVLTRCDYNHLVEFLWRLEKDNPLLRIKNITISSAKGAAHISRVQFAIQWPVSMNIERGAN
jgi:hypothetical protein